MCIATQNVAVNQAAQQIAGPVVQDSWFSSPNLVQVSNEIAYFQFLRQ